MQEPNMTESDYAKLDEYLAYLSIKGDTHIIAYTALRLQIELENSKRINELWGEITK
jgi:hypothetical protein